jgi:hypothetical protein
MGNIVRTDRTDIKRIMVYGDFNSFRPERGRTSWPKLLEDKVRFILIFLINAVTAVPPDTTLENAIVLRLSAKI